MQGFLRVVVVDVKVGVAVEIFEFGQHLYPQQP